MARRTNMVMSDPKRPRLRWLLFLRCTFVALASLVPLGCYNRTAIKPTELPDLSNAFAAPVSGNGRLIAVSVAHVEKPDGTIVEIRGEFDVIVRLETGTELEFTHPVRARLDPSGMVLSIAGGNRSERRIPLDRITGVEVSQFDAVGASVAGAFVGVGVGVLIFALSH